MDLKVSIGNTKMGAIKSISLPAIKTCRDCACKKKCYAAKLERLRPTVRAAYQNNLDLLLSDPEKYWRQAEAAVMMCSYFRFHVSGDILNADYFQHMVDLAWRQSQCQILCFTKKYEIVNSFLTSGKTIPSNLHIIFSGWTGLKMNNPFNLPEAHVAFRDGTTTARGDAIPCGGNCTECSCTDKGCWVLKAGQQVVFHEH